MTKMTMLDRSQCPKASVALKAIATASKAANTPGPGAWAFYLGGTSHNKGKGSTWTNEVLDELAKNGVHLLPIYVGLQKQLSHARGVSDATDAIRLNHAFKDRHTTVCADIEKATGERDLAAAVEYVNGWTQTLHDAGLRSLVYCSVDLAEKLKKGNPKADAIWVPRYRAHGPQPTRDPHAIPGITGFTEPGQRGWQYAAAFADKPDGPVLPCNVEGINVDVSCIDSEVFDVAVRSKVRTASTAPAKVPAPRAAPATKAAPTSGTTVTVKDGDNLSRLEAKLKLKQGTLFPLNRAIIEQVARQHGLKDSQHGAKIFAGTVLHLP